MYRKKRKRLFVRLLFGLLSVMLLITAGCTTEEDDPTYAISGAVSIEGTGDALAGVTISLTGAANASATTDSDGNFSLSSITDGTYTLTPSLSGYTFEPVSTVVVVSGANITDINFVATATGGWDTYSISGTVTGEVQTDVKLTLSGGGSGTVMTNSDGTYTFNNLIDGYIYTVTPSRSGYTFDPEYREVTISGANAVNIDFTSSL